MNIKNKFLAIFTVLMFLISNMFIYPKNISADESIKEIKPYDDVREKDLSKMDFRGKSDLLYTLSFDTYTKWPSKDKLPKDFDPYKLMEKGKDPGLGIRKLQSEGYTGSGVSVAYIDQHLLLNHKANKNIRLHNYEVQQMKEPNSWRHGTTVLSILAGKERGIIPDSEVYFFAYNRTEDENEYEAKAFERILELNKTLPENKKIKIIAMSSEVDEISNIQYAKHLKIAQEKARRSGIIVIDMTKRMATCGVKGFKNRDNRDNYEISNINKKFPEGRLIVPVDNITTAIGYNGDVNHYAYWSKGGLSWGVPYITGLIAMGLQANPNLTENEACQYLYESGYDFQGGRMVNPEGFIKMVKKNLKNLHDVKLNGDINTKGNVHCYPYFEEEFMKVHSLNVEKDNNKVYLKLKYTCNRENITYNFFSPTNERSICKKGEVKKGNNTLVIELTMREFAKVLESKSITMVLGGNVKKVNFISFETNQLKSLLNFETDYKAGNIVINELRGEKTTKGYQLVLDYSSLRELNFGLFNAPNGDKIRIIKENVITRGNNILKIELSEKEFKNLIESKEIAIKFGVDQRVDIIIFKPKQFSNLLNSTKIINNNGNMQCYPYFEEDFMKIHSLNVEKNNNKVYLKLKYTCDRENITYSFFSPTNEGSICKKGEVKKGDNTLVIELTMREFAKVLESRSITMLLWGNIKKVNFISFQTNQLKSLLNFETHYEAGNIVINSIKAEKIQDGVQIIVNCDSLQDTDYSFFNPPDGDKLMIVRENGVKKGSNVLRINLTNEQFKKVLSSEDITMKFGFKEKSDWIVFNIKQFRRFLEDKDEYEDKKIQASETNSIRFCIKLNQNIKMKKVELFDNNKFIDSTEVIKDNYAFMEHKGSLEDKVYKLKITVEDGRVCFTNVKVQSTLKVLKVHDRDKFIEIKSLVNGTLCTNNTSRSVKSGEVIKVKLGESVTIKPNTTLNGVAYNSVKIN